MKINREYLKSLKESIKHIKCEKLLEILSKNSSYFVKEAVAENPNTPIETLEVLSKDLI